MAKNRRSTLNESVASLIDTPPDVNLEEIEDDDEEMDDGEPTQEDVQREKDVFIVAKSYVDKNIPIYFQIYRNSTFCGKAEWPYDWNVLQKEHGQGFYRVELRTASNNRIRKNQSLNVNALKTDTVAATLAMPGVSSEAGKSIGAFDFLATMEKMRETSKVETAALLEKQDKEKTGMFGLIMQMMQSSSASQAAIQSENTRMLMTLMAEQSKSQAAMFAAMHSGKQDKSPGILEILALADSKAKDAREESARMYALVDKKADEKAEIYERIADMQVKVESKRGDGSLVDKLIEGIFPLAKQFMETSAKTAALQASQPQPGVAGGSRVVARSNPVRVIEQRKEPSVKEKLEKLLSAEIQSAIPGGKSPEETAIRVRAMLDKEGITQEQAKVLFPKADLIGQAKAGGYPEFVVKWLERFYDAALPTVQTSPGSAAPLSNGAAPVSAESSQTSGHEGSAEVL